MNERTKILLFFFMIYLFVSNDAMHMLTFNVYMLCVYAMNACMYVHAYELDMWEYLCLTVDLTIILITPSSSLHLLIFCDCCVSLDSRPFTLLHLKVT